MSWMVEEVMVVMMMMMMMMMHGLKRKRRNTGLRKAGNLAPYVRTGIIACVYCYAQPFGTKA